MEASMKRILCGVFGGLFLLAISCSSVWAQATAQISGTAKDQSGAVLPGVEIRAVQTETGSTRDAITNETGLFVLSNLPIGPYRLEATLPGFRTYAQTGIVLNVNSNPTINVVLEIGQVSEQVEVQANAALVETRSAGLGTVMENTSILELPLNGRNLVDLVSLSPATNPAPLLNGTGGRDPFSKGNVSIAGGLNSGLNYTLDGAYHNNPYDNSYMSMPFPDALQEFKVETGATGIGNGVKSAGTVSLVTKSGTNDFHGDLFEFVRNGKFNARNAFATKRDSIKRNQFGGTIGGPIVQNKLFFFGGYQRTTIRQAPSDLTAIVPTAAMTSGDFTAFTSAACNGGRPITLKAPFINNRVDPSLLSKVALNLAGKMKPALDECGTYKYGIPSLENDNMTLGRIDYQRTASHSIFGRFLMDTIVNPPPMDLTKDPMNSNDVGTKGTAYAFSVGDTYLFGGGANIVNAFRVTANRINGEKSRPETWETAGIGSADIGVKAYAYYPHRPLAGPVAGAFSFGGASGPAHGYTNGAAFSVNDDLSVLRGQHQLTFGAQSSFWMTSTLSDVSAVINPTFNGSVAGTPMADFFLGAPTQLVNGSDSLHHKQVHYHGFYGGDTWKLNPKWTMSYGLRWEPYFPMTDRDRQMIHFDPEAFAKGIKSTRFSTTPPGVLYPGDPGVPVKSGMYNKWWNFSPRLGFAWDINGDGRTSIRLSAGTFYDFPPTISSQGFSNSPPFKVQIIRNGVSLDDPWKNEPGGDPFPIASGRSVTRDTAIWPAYGSFWTAPYDTANMQVYQWNLVLQRQVGSDLLVSATYLGNQTRHLWTAKDINPARFLGLGPCTLQGAPASTCSTTGNTNQRRLYSLGSAATSQYFGSIAEVDPGSTASYNGLLLSLQRRAARGVTVTANYTWSHCISDPSVTDALTTITGYQADPQNRRYDRGNCNRAAADLRQVFSSTAVIDTPQFSAPVLRTIASGWRVSPILKILTGGYLNITSGQDRNLTGVGYQRPNQLLANPYGDKTVNNYLNPAAFEQPALGTNGNIGANSVRGPGWWQLDASVSRTFQVKETQRVELRVEAFNVTNSLRLDNPTTAINSTLFGKITTAKDPRIMQFALKYLF
jgi:hypothetical protein